ncbi:MAG: hypothetical protein U0Q04_04200 [Microbacterium sp.]
MLARTSILDARGLGIPALQMHEASLQMQMPTRRRPRAMRRRWRQPHGAISSEALGGYAAEAEAASIAHNLFPDRILDQLLEDARRSAPPDRTRASLLLGRADDDPRRARSNRLHADSAVWPLSS